ncbi:ABC transporter permease [Marinitenerispora sediminis]|uniref:Transport permease protein n=1 Tax=Marinitenerispora sediminis TaxID=1931232 RepID=A0A368T621_9ACTN|nr:ABC transporter permease [Marinitenerispora sediminis]RCV51518.1 ABC transporter [Marinitenerispora sediminis]RCV55191.1 ABC transporter [Marinitenerispora sediminis]RCV59131.1 ABC transporter [Marinitenerispora sediminis]
MTDTTSAAVPHGGSATFAPRPGAAALPRMIRAQAGMELRIMLRNGEQLLLTMVIPVLLLVGFGATSLIDVGGGSRVDFLTPGVLALAVMSTAFTGQAIGTGFERRYGVLKRLGATPLPRFGLLAAKTLAVLAVQAVQVTVISAVALALGWSPAGGPLGALAAGALILLGTAAFSSLALLMAGTLRAEATLAAANLVYVVLLGLGGVLFPIDRYPDVIRPVTEALPITALTSGLRAVLTEGGGLPVAPLLVLAVWTVVGTVLASRFFRWE